MNRRNLFTAGAGAAGAAALGAAAIGAVARPTPAGASQGRIPDVPVWTHEGHRVRFYDDLVRGRVVTLNFMFVGCGGVCPLVTENLRRVQELLGDRVGRDVFMYSVTLRPELETPDVLRDYAAQHGVGPGWSFLTGAPADIERLRVGLGFRSVDPELDVLADEHTGMLRYGNEPLDRWGATAGLSRPEWIAKAVTTALLVA